MKESESHVRDYSEDNLAFLLARERSRCLRYHLRSSLVVFDLSKTLRPERNLAALMRGLTNRVRTADSIGRLDKRRIGLLLPATGVEGADKVVHDVLGGWPSEEIPSCSVQCYSEDNSLVPKELVVDHDSMPAGAATARKGRDLPKLFR